MSHNLAARAKELALLFTSWPSVTGSQEEARVAGKLVERFSHFADPAEGTDRDCVPVVLHLEHFQK